MRSFEERKAEIFRRSHERIRERKRRRNRILTFSVSLCMILLFSLITLPPILTQKDKNAFPEEGMDMVAGTDLKGGSYIQTEVLNDESTLLSDVSKITFSEVERICNLMKSFLPAAEESILDGSADLEENKENSDQSSSEKYLSDYRITFLKDGKEMEVYILSGSVLTEEKTNRRATLTEDQRAQILKELGL